jgi:TolB protein
MDADGANVTRLTNSPARDHSPAWSPDGRQIAFVSERDGNPEIYVMNADGTEVTRLTKSPAQDLWPAWSPRFAPPE